MNAITNAISIIPPQFGGSIPYYDVNDNDVLCGRGTSHCTHPGNRRFHFLAKKFRDDYATARSKEEKTAISRSIVKAIRMENGRFLRKKEGKSTAHGSWQELGDKKAWEKTCQLLRETIIKHSNKKKMHESRQEKKQQVHRSTQRNAMNRGQDRDLVTPSSPYINIYQEQTAVHAAPVPIPIIADDSPRFQDQVLQWSRNGVSCPILLSRHQATLSPQDFDSRMGQQQLHTPPRSPPYDLDNYYYQNGLYQQGSSYQVYPQSTSGMSVNGRSPSPQSMYQNVSSNFKYMMQSMNESERIMAEMGIVPGDSVSRYQI